MCLIKSSYSIAETAQLQQDSQGVRLQKPDIKVLLEQIGSHITPECIHLRLFAELR